MWKTIGVIVHWLLVAALVFVGVFMWFIPDLQNGGLCDTCSGSWGEVPYLSAAPGPLFSQGPLIPTTEPPTGVVEPTSEPALAGIQKKLGESEESVVQSGGQVQTYNYEPGGESYGQAATDVAGCPLEEGQCTRIWQGTNLQNFPWTFFYTGMKASEPAPKLQWPHATQLTVSGTGTVEFNLHRDLGAVAQLQTLPAGSWDGLDPYDVANAKQSPLGLGWFVQGFNAEVCVDGDCKSLDGGGVYQLNFPKDMEGAYNISITVNGGQAQFWQGERLTDNDTWPLPGASATATN